MSNELPLHKTQHELEVILATALGKILANNIAAEAFDRRPDKDADDFSVAWAQLRPSDVIANLHLYERLLDAAEALRALRDYAPEHRGYAKISEH